MVAKVLCVFAYFPCVLVYHFVYFPQSLKHVLNFSEITAVNLSCEQERMCKNSSKIAVLVKYNPLMRLDKHSIMLSITEIIMKVNNQCLSCILVEEVESVMKFMSETTAQWRNLSVEVRSVRSMLEEVIANWDRYSSTVAGLQAWLEDAEKMLNQTEQSKKV